MTFVLLLFSASLWASSTPSSCGFDLVLTRFHVVRPRAVTTLEWDRAKQRASAETYAFSVTYPFEMQATQVTAAQWNYVEGAMPPSRPLQAAHDLSCGRIERFLDRLNELSREGDPGLADYFEGHQTGDVYRLPYEQEWALVISLALLETKQRKGQLELNDYAWHAGNSRKVVHDVGGRQPLYLDGLPFYDLLGNLEELTADPYTDRMSDLPPLAAAARVARGGSTKTRGTLEELCLRRGRVYWRDEPTDQDRFLGFRLVREYARRGEGHLPFVHR